MLQQELCGNVGLVQFVFMLCFCSSHEYVIRLIHSNDLGHPRSLGFFASLPSPTHSLLPLHWTSLYPCWVFRLRLESYWLMSFCTRIPDYISQWNFTVKSNLRVSQSVKSTAALGRYYQNEHYNNWSSRWREVKIAIQLRDQSALKKYLTC